MDIDRIPLFDNVPKDRREAIAKQLRWRRFQPGEQIIDRQSDSNDVFFLVEGRVRVVIYSLAGREVTLDDLFVGGYFGELAAIDGEPRSATVMALQPSLVAMIGRDAFLNVIAVNPEVALGVMQRLASMVRHATNRIMDLSTLGANNRVHAEILRQGRLAHAETGEWALRPAPVHSDIASRVSTTRETVARVLNDLARRDIVRRERDGLMILNLDELESMVEEVRGE